jgi:hypothetical protein
MDWQPVNYPRDFPDISGSFRPDFCVMSASPLRSALLLLAFVDPGAAILKLVAPDGSANTWQIGTNHSTAQP